jgi:hypothetical protein
MTHGGVDLGDLRVTSESSTRRWQLGRDASPFNFIAVGRRRLLTVKWGGMSAARLVNRASPMDS